jgi:hypothetical protein
MYLTAMATVPVVEALVVARLAPSASGGAIVTHTKFDTHVVISLRVKRVNKSRESEVKRSVWHKACAHRSTPKQLK